MTSTSAAPANAWATAKLYADEAATASAAAEAAYRQMQELRRASYTADQLREDKRIAAEAAAGKVRDIARALAWQGVGIIDDQDPTLSAPYRDRVALRAAFAHGRVSVRTWDGRAPRGHAFGWLLGSARSSTTVELYKAASGTNDPAKLAVQAEAADAALRDWLAQHTAEAFLSAERIGPEPIDPEDGEPFTLDIDAIPSSSGGSLWHRPTWRLLLAGVEVAKIDDRRELLTAVDKGGAAYLGGPAEYDLQQTILGDPPDDLSGALAYARKHADRALAALLRSLGPQPR